MSKDAPVPVAHGKQALGAELSMEIPRTPFGPSLTCCEMGKSQCHSPGLLGYRGGVLPQYAIGRLRSARKPFPRT